jgi:polysaccharide biosynthesis protein PslG
MLCATTISPGVELRSQADVVVPRIAYIPVVLAAAVNEAPTTLGIADSTLYTLSDKDLTATLEHLQAMGVTDIRIGIPWVYMQPANSRETVWTDMDRVVAAAEAHNMNIVGAITGTPPWAGFPLNGHSDPEDYAAFAGAVAARYNGANGLGEIDDYEIWNEPNGALFYNPVSASAYTAMLNAAYPAIHQANPDAVVIAGVLGSVRTISGLSEAPQSFVAKMYANGAQFDALSFHPYQYTLPFSKGQSVDNSPVNQAEAIRALMIANGDADKKIWVTEYGLPTNFPISAAQQAAFIHDFVLSWQSVDGAGPIFVYTTRDSHSGGFDDEQNFGIFYTNWKPKRAVATISTLITALQDGSWVDDDFDVTPYAQNTFLDQFVIVARQFINLTLIVPRALFQLAVSAVTVLTQAVVDGVKSVVTQVAGGFSAATVTAAAAPTALSHRGAEAQVASDETAALPQRDPEVRVAAAAAPVEGSAKPDGVAPKWSPGEQPPGATTAVGELAEADLDDVEPAVAQDDPDATHSDDRPAVAPTSTGEGADVDTVAPAKPAEVDRDNAKGVSKLKLPRLKSLLGGQKKNHRDAGADSAPPSAAAE